MTIGRSEPRGIIKEHVSFNIARIKKGGETFEIVIKDPDKALAFRQGKETDMSGILEIDKIYKDAKKGEIQSPEDIKKWLGTDKPLEAAKMILKKGEFHLTAEQRKKMFEIKKKKLIDYINMNAFDPKTGLPHPVTRIELAMEQAKVQIDPYTPIESQMEKIISELRPILPLSFEKITLLINIPARFASAAYSKLKSKFSAKKEVWKNDGSVEFEIQVAAGVKADVLNLINKLTNGEATIEETK